MLFLNFIRFNIIFILLSQIFVDCRVFKQSTIDELFDSEQTKHYLPSEKSSNFESDVVKLFIKRSADDRNIELEIKAFGKRDVASLTLDDAEFFMSGDTPVWLGMEKNGEHVYEKCRSNTPAISVRSFSSQNANCFVLIDTLNQRPKRNIRINGMMGDLVIRSLDEDTIHRVRRSKREIDENDFYKESENFTATDYHLVYREKNSEENIIIHDDRIKRSDSTSLPPIATIYPKILVTTHFNSELTVTQYSLIETLVLHLLSFWATVDMKFRQFEHRFSRLHLSGIIIETRFGETPYIAKEISNNGSELNVTRSLFFMENDFRYPSQQLAAVLEKAPTDIVIAMTSLKLCDFSKRSSVCERINGKAQIVGEYCDPGDNGKSWRINLFSIIHAEPTNFKGIFTAAHEIGHLLGAVDDGARGGGESCLRSNYYMMSGHSHPDRIPISKNIWSSCSINSIHQTAVRRITSPCMNFQKKPDSFRVCIPLPGEIQKRDSQCIARNAERACGKNSCLLRCECSYSSPGCSEACTVKGYVLDGTSCRNSERFHCINGRCIPKP